MPALRAAIPRLLATVFCLSFVGASCGPAALGVMPGVLNDPHNYSLRKSILAYGLDHVCDEVRARSMPLRFHDEDPVAGRFFPTACVAHELPDGNLQIQLAGQGYVWTRESLRLGFGAGAAVAYDTDFLLDGSTMYVYFRPRASAPPTFTTRFIENSGAVMMAGMLGLQGAASLPDRVGAQIMAVTLARGFTVIREANGGVAYGIGLIPPGSRPPEAYRGLDHDRPVLANERVDLRRNQRDFAGPFEVTPGKELGLLLDVTGTAPLVVRLVSKPIGDAWLLSYTSQVAFTPPPGPPVLEEVVTPGATLRRSLAVPPGLYYLVLDNTPNPGRTSPVTYPRDAVVSYAVDLE